MINVGLPPHWTLAILALSVQFIQGYLFSVHTVYSKSSCFCPCSLLKVIWVLTIQFTQSHLVRAFLSTSCCFCPYTQNRLVSVYAVGSKSYCFCPFSLLKVILFLSIQFTQSDLIFVRTVYSVILLLSIQFTQSSSFCPYSLFKVILFLSVQFTQSHLVCVRAVRSTSFYFWFWSGTNNQQPMRITYRQSL